MTKPKSHSTEIAYNHIAEPMLLNPKQAASFIPCALASLNNSRYTGILCGADAPAYIKRGKSVFYKRETLMSWNEQFEERRSTSESVA